MCYWTIISAMFWTILPQSADLIFDLSFTGGGIITKPDTAPPSRPKVANPHSVLAGPSDTRGTDSDPIHINSSPEDSSPIRRQARSKTLQTKKIKGSHKFCGELRFVDKLSKKDSLYHKV